MNQPRQWSDPAHSSAEPPSQPATETPKPSAFARLRPHSKASDALDDARRSLSEIGQDRSARSTYSPITRPVAATVLQDGEELDILPSLDEPDATATYTPASAPSALNTSTRTHTNPFAALLAFLVAIVRSIDLSLFRDVRRFLAHPGAFFWFQRTAPGETKRGASHDAMTHVVRRFGAHTAVLSLAVLVVLFGGFTGITRAQAQGESDYANASDGASNGGSVTTLGSEQELYLNTLGVAQTDKPRRIEVYTWKKGDSLKSVAAAHSIDMDTLLYANHLFDPDQTFDNEGGKKLAIPPVNGMLHIVERHIAGRPDDTIESIAQQYQVDPKVIIGFAQNNVTADSKLSAGQEIMVPGGKRPARDTILNYIVRNGDTLKSIAAKFGLDVRTIAENNDINGEVKVGDSLTIPQGIGLVIKGKTTQSIDGLAWYFGNISPDSIRQYPGNASKFDANGHPVNGENIFIPGGVIPTPTPTPIPTPTPRPTATPVPVVVQKPNSAPAPAAAAAKSGNAPAASAPKSSGSNAAAPYANAPISSGNKAPAAAPPKSSGNFGGGLSSQQAGTFNQPGGNTGYVAPSSNGVATGHFIWPITGTITTPFWLGRPASQGGPHTGIDIATTYGTPVKAADGGLVVYASWSIYGYGNFVIIDHGNGFTSRYGHLSGFAVGAGQRVSQGQVIGYEGSTGNSTGPHCHFEITVNNSVHNPMSFLP